MYQMQIRPGLRHLRKYRQGLAPKRPTAPPGPPAIREPETLLENDNTPTPRSKIEFKTLPPPTAPAPVEDVSELEEALRGLLLAQTFPQKVEPSQQLICPALRGEELHVLIGPPRLHIGQMKGGLKR